MNSNDDRCLKQPTPPHEVEWSWLNSIDQIPKTDWDRCFSGGGVLQSYALQKATERSGIPSACYHYLTGRVNGRIEAIMPCFEFRISLVLVAPAFVQKIVCMIRRIFRDFLFIRAFIAGTPVAICKDLFGLRGDARQLLGQAAMEIADRASHCGSGLIILKEITAPEVEEVSRQLGERFIIAESPATTFLSLGTDEHSTYRASLRKKYRSVMTGRLRKFEQSGMYWKKVGNLKPYSQQLTALYMQVLERSKIRFELLTVNFFEEISQQMPESMFAMLCFKGKELVAFEMFLHDENALHPLYLGLDYRHRDQGALYFNCIYKIIELAEERDFEYVELGQTSYATKAGLGAVISPLYLAVCHSNPVMRWALRKLKPVLFPGTPTPRCQRTFKDIDALSSRLSELGVPFILGERHDD
ncbi:MAG: GNAT family N-acetyltransferase [Xanthomonadaceae bacterium]|nr:GNAT family N-acetyltransferase [Xanthomonadaceae bacterium]